MAAHAMTWALARHPERGFPIPGTSFHIWPVYLRHIEYAVYYKFDDSQVELLAIIPSNQEGVF